MKFDRLLVVSTQNTCMTESHCAVSELKHADTRPLPPYYALNWHASNINYKCAFLNDELKKYLDLRIYLATANILANARHAWLYESAVRAMRKKTEIKFWRWRLWYQEMQTKLCWCLWWGLAESAFGGNLSQAVSFVLARLTRTWLQSPWRCFHILLLTKFYKWRIFNAIWKYNVSINCITVQHKEGSFP
jgi:hypothetical protein